VVYQLRVSLRLVTPMVWRRLLVTSDTTVARLHTVVQTAMGWEDLHLHQFRLADFKLRKGERFIYDYDMGDFWQHDLRLEQTFPLDPKKRYPVCTAGAGDCPPEDCGGPAGYAALLAAHCAWPEWEDAREDAALVAQRLLDWQHGGPRPTDDDSEFTNALERMQERLAELPTAFDRRAVNATLRQW
jgi:hypothetical protein